MEKVAACLGTHLQEVCKLQAPSTLASLVVTPGDHHGGKGVWVKVCACYSVFPIPPTTTQTFSCIPTHLVHPTWHWTIPCSHVHHVTPYLQHIWCINIASIQMRFPRAIGRSSRENNSFSWNFVRDITDHDILFQVCGDYTSDYLGIIHHAGSNHVAHFCVLMYQVLTR